MRASTSHILTVLATLSLVYPSIHGLNVPLRVTRYNQFSTRAVDTSNNQHALKLTNNKDNIYNAAINLGGQDVVVQLDTGSSDLWVKNPSIKPSLVTGVPVKLKYGQGMVSGPLSFAPMTIAGFSIPRQSFVQGDQVDDLDALFNNGATGTMGLGFPIDATGIKGAIDGVPTAPRTDARSPLENIFAANASLPNFFTFLLGRLEGPSDETNGVFTISEYVNAFSNVSTTQQLPSQTPEHWSVLIDGVKIGGRVASINSGQKNVPAGKAVAVLDTGFSFPPVPPALVNAIYSTIPGAVQADDLSGFGAEWLIPCDQVVSLSFTIGGRDFPVHPLDLTQIATLTLQGRNITFCQNTFKPLQLDPQSFSGFDMILGDAFLRNAYVAFNYGSRDTRGQVTGEPFVQMISTTNIEEAQNEFAAIRKKQLQSFPPPFSPVQLRAAALGQAALPSAPTTTDSTPQNLSTNSASSAPVLSPTSTGVPSAETEGEKKNASPRMVSVGRLFHLPLPIFVALVAYLLA